MLWIKDCSGLLKRLKKLKAKLYIGCHTEERNEYGYPKFKAEVVIDVQEYGQATHVLRGLEMRCKELLDKGQLIKQYYADGVIKI